MKKIRLYALISLILGFLLIISSIVIPIILISNYTASNGSVGIIGGADSPTWFFLFYKLNGQFTLIPILGIILFLAGLFCLIFTKTVLQNCTIKSTSLALIISLFGSSGFVCVLIWCVIIGFDPISNHPISYPASIAGGVLSLLAFIISIVFYIKSRKRNLKLIGILIDVLTAALTLPFFIFLFIIIYNFLSSLF